MDIEQQHIDIEQQHIDRALEWLNEYEGEFSDDRLAEVAAELAHLDAYNDAREKEQEIAQ